jgi:DNA polymerase-1
MLTTLLIDGNNTLHRAHWVANNTGQKLVNSKGINVGTLFTFLKTVKSYADQFNTSSIYIAWDKKLTNKVNFRKELTGGTYKGTRNQEKNQEVYEIMDSVVEATGALGIKNIFPGRLEADDVISWLSSNTPGKKIIISVDKDFIQLIKEEVDYYNPIKKETIDKDNFFVVLNLLPEEYLYYKAIVGDVSDNITGVEGFGKVKGAKLAKAFCKNDESVIAPYKELVLNNLKLVDLTYGIAQYPEEQVIYQEQVESLKAVKFNIEKFIEVCENNEFPSILNKMDSWQHSFNQKNLTDVLNGYFKLFE